MEFKYSFNDSEAKPNPSLSPEAIRALSKKAIGESGIDSLLGKSEFPEIEQLKDNIESQCETSWGAVKKIIEQLNTLRGTNKLYTPLDGEFHNIILSKIDEWEENGSLEWCKSYIEQNGGSMTLLATPNTLTTYEEISELARDFGGSQVPPQETFVYDDLYKLYQPEELSGPLATTTGSDQNPSIRLSLIPTTLDPSLKGTVETQRAQLLNLQTNNPNVKLQVPSVLDGVTRWQTLKEQGGSLNDSTTHNKTLIRHFDLEEKELGRRARVPRSYVGHGGRPYLVSSGVGVNCDARVSVG